jgi:lysozyme
MTVKDLITRHEGCEPRRYQDTDGHWTVGVGHNLDADPLDPALYEPDGSLSATTIDEVLDEDIALATVAVRRLCDPWYLNLNAQRQAVLVDMAFEMGGAGLQTFQVFLGCVSAGNFTAAADAMLASKWATEEAPARAQEDAMIMRTGAWPT